MRGFRVWSDYWKKYATEAELHMDGSVDAIFEDADGVPHHENTDLVLEFNTGLKDKNGKEIYKGDIVEALIDGVWDVGMNDISFGKVKWKLKVIRNKIRFMDIFEVIGSKSSPYRSYYLFDQALSELEVIGNVHENLDLLGDTNVTNKEEE